ncbi:hypothetical protein [Latilactobacillus fuchuensis]|uniref:Uncharacterized protein n=2 Tax=Latilactobacillus fuchuensis TaxID=164393 RepID=A0A2N9DY96_9LACO|nr:hypothetical protein [Latilactobacillus fuchuensis]KRL59607.1 hypothetical protein FC69_GL001567 [Latilactobacillus fuchuensis DSM 14340 = JCM 11249]MCP8858130.1 hypothetical protein [Latilactobacillus fuchuensis]SPC40111.1 conserved hypothetical protein [Latilactobacillus fuchuensis]
MLNKQPLETGKLYFATTADVHSATFQTPEKPYIIDYQHPKIIPFLTGWDNLLMKPHQDLKPFESLINQHIKHFKTTPGAQLKPIQQLWIQLVRGLLGHHQLFILADYLDELTPTTARQLLVDLKQIAEQYAIVLILTTNQQTIFKNFQDQVVS